MNRNFHPFGNIVFSARAICCGVQEAIVLMVNNLMPDDSFAENEFTKLQICTMEIQSIQTTMAGRWTVTLE